MPDGPYTPKLLSRLVRTHEALDRAGLSHAVGGAIALALYTHDPRFTADIDLNVIVDPDNPAALLDALPDDVEVHPTAAAELRRDGQVRVMWRDPDTPLDLFVPQHPTYHQLANDRARPADFGGVTIPVLSATDLMVFKMLFNRPKDWVDIQSLIEAGAGDADEAATWVARFLGDDDPRLAKLAEVRADAASARSSPMTAKSMFHRRGDSH